MPEFTVSNLQRLQLLVLPAEKNWWARQDYSVRPWTPPRWGRHAVGRCMTFKIVPDDSVACHPWPRRGAPANAVQDRSMRSCVEPATLTGSRPAGNTAEWWVRQDCCVPPCTPPHWGRCMTKSVTQRPKLLPAILSLAVLGRDAVRQLTLSKIAPCDLVSNLQRLQVLVLPAEKIGGPGRTRTCNQEIMSLLH